MRRSSPRLFRTAPGSALAAALVLPACYLTHELAPSEQASPAPPPAPPQVRPPAAPLVLHPQMARGSSHACVLLDDGSVHCWGSNTFGQVGVPRAEAGLGLNYLQHSPVRVPGLPLIQQISASSAQSCALDIHGRVHCWGLNEQGQLGVGMEAAPDECPTADAHGLRPNDCAQRPVEVPGLEQVIQISAGGTHACALRADRSVLCWGWMTGARHSEFDAASLSEPDAATVRGDYYVQSTPRVVEGLAKAAQVVAGPNAQGPGHSCAVLEDGGLQCWGNAAFGQTGPSGRAAFGADAAVFRLPARAVHVAAGSHHSCAVAEDGAVYCWGNNYQQALGADVVGDGPCETFSVSGECIGPVTLRVTTPVRVDGVSNAVAVSIYELATCALLADKMITCWHGGERWQVAGVSDVVELSGNCATVRGGRVLCWEGKEAAEVVPEVRLAYGSD